MDRPLDAGKIKIGKLGFSQVFGISKRSKRVDALTIVTCLRPRGNFSNKRNQFLLVGPLMKSSLGDGDWRHQGAECFNLHPPGARGSFQHQVHRNGLHALQWLRSLPGESFKLNNWAPSPDIMTPADITARSPEARAAAGADWGRHALSWLQWPGQWARGVLVINFRE